MKCKPEETKSIEYYRVIVIFSKYYNTWFVQINSDNIVWNKYLNKYNVIKILIQNDNAEFKEVQLEKDGHWNQKYLSSIKNIFEILSVELKL